MPEKKKAITLLSGGLDSMVSTAIARKKHNISLALTFDYGQRAAKREIAASSKFCRLWKIRHKVIELPWLKEITHTALVDHHHDIPRFSTQTLKHSNTQTLSAKAVWVPNRNALFINIAASFAESMKADIIIAGFNKEEGATFPDNSSRFVSTVNRTLRYSSLRRLTVRSYTQNMDKIGIMRYALRHKLPIWDCWPCYRGGKWLCGRCESCERFLSALENS